VVPDCRRRPLESRDGRRRASDLPSLRQEAQQLLRHLGRALLRHPVAAARDAAARHVRPELLQHRYDLQTVRMLPSEGQHGDRQRLLLPGQRVLVVDREGAIPFKPSPQVSGLLEGPREFLDVRDRMRSQIEGPVVDEG